MNKSVFIYREGAFGDHVHMSNILKAFDEDGWDITFMYNLKGRQIHAFNPRIKNHLLFESRNDMSQEELETRNSMIVENIKKHDRFVNLNNSLENTLIANEKTPEYFWPLHLRRAKNANICYYDQSAIVAGLTGPKYMGMSGEIFFTSDDHEFIKGYLKKHIPEDAHITLIAMRGSMWQKAIYPWIENLCRQWLSKHPKSYIITTGDKFCQQWEWEHPRVLHKSGIIPFRQALHLSRYVDMVITPETGLGIGAGAFGTPKIMLLTAASIKNIVGNDKNDYSLQSPAYCSPCTRAIYNTNNCPLGRIVRSFEFHNQKWNNVYLPICVEFDIDLILQQMETIYENHGRYGYEKRNSPKREEVVYC